MKWQTDHEWSFLISCQSYLLKCQCIQVQYDRHSRYIHCISLTHTHRDFVTALSLDIAFIDFSTSHGLVFDFWPHTIPKDVQSSLNALPAMYCC